MAFATQDAQIPFSLKLFSALWVPFLAVLWRQCDSDHTIADCIKYALNPTCSVKIWCLGPVWFWAEKLLDCVPAILNPSQVGRHLVGISVRVKTMKPLLWLMELCAERTNMHKYLPRIVGPQFSCVWQTFQLNFQEILFLIDLRVSNLESQRCFLQGEFRVWKLPSYVKLVILLYHEWLNLTPREPKIMLCDFLAQLTQNKCENVYITANCVLICLREILARKKWAWNFKHIWEVLQSACK